MSEWIMQLPSIVFTRIKTQFPEKIKEQYGMTSENFSSESNTNEDAIFPFVYVKLLPAVEQGADLDGTSINGGLFTFQIDVYDNESQSRAKNVMAEIVAIMKSLRFQIVAMPEFEKTETYRSTARFRRIFGALDTF